jgi:hypothetical protein
MCKVVISILDKLFLEGGGRSSLLEYMGMWAVLQIKIRNGISS